jgi:hypothetical protein
MSETAVSVPTPRSFGERFVGALKLDATVYEEVEHDASALPQAAGVVALAAVATAIGHPAAEGLGMLGSIVGSLIGWALSAGFIWIIGVRLFEHTSDYQELLRTIGFAQAPQLVMLLGIVPILGGLAVLAAAVWGLAAYVIAVRQALDVSTGRAVWVCVLAFGLAVLSIALLGWLFS